MAARNSFKGALKATVLVQSLVRTFLAKCKFRVVQRKAAKIQSVVRMRQGVKTYASQQKAAVYMQGLGRRLIVQVCVHVCACVRALARACV